MESQKSSNPIPDEEAPDSQDEQPRTIAPPFAVGDELLLNGRELFVHHIGERAVVFRGKAYGAPAPPGSKKKAFLLGDQFEWKGWAFEVNKIVAPKFKKKFRKGGTGRRAGAPELRIDRHFEIHAIPFAVRRDMLGDQAPPLRPEEMAAVEGFADKVMAQLSPPAVTDQRLVEDWANGVEAFFRGAQVADCPYGGAIVGMDEAPQSADARLIRRTYWVRGWEEAQRAAKALTPPDAEGNGHRPPPAPPAARAVVNIGADESGVPGALAYTEGDFYVTLIPQGENLLIREYKVRLDHVGGDQRQNVTSKDAYPEDKAREYASIWVNLSAPDRLRAKAMLQGDETEGTGEDEKTIG